MFGSDCEVTSEIFFSTKNTLLRKKSLFLSCCKINQNMESGDIIYLLLLLFFMILGFFNDSKKKKNQQKQQSEKPPHPYPEKLPRSFTETSDMVEEETPPLWFETRPVTKTKTSPSSPPVQRSESERPTFRSSMDLTTDFSKETSLKSSIFVFDADSSYDLGSDSIDISAMSDSYLEKGTEETVSETKESSYHHLIRDLLGDAGRDELKKGLIYGEIMQRRY